jgi:polysaccharide biosynthesis protein PslH
MKILVITTKSPYPLNEGRALRTFNLIREMAHHHELHLISFVQDAQDVSGLEHMRSICKVVTAVPLYLGWRKGKLALDVVSELVGPEPLAIIKYRHRTMEAAIRSAMRAHAYDVVHLDMLHLASYLPLIGRTPTLLMEHNVEAQIVQRRAQTEASWLKRWYLHRQAAKLRVFEANVCRAASKVVAVSANDVAQLEKLSGRIDIVCVPNGVDTSYFTPSFETQASGKRRTLVYVGGFTWHPNQDAIEYFCQEIFPAIRREAPDVVLRVIGKYRKSASSAALQAQEGVELCGLVDDIRPYVRDAQAYIVPLRIGGGTRLKILDALAMGKAIVSTSIGCEGLEVTPGRDILIADEPAAFARAVLSLLNEPARAAVLGQHGRRLVEERYDWSAIANTLNAAYTAAVKAATHQGTSAHDPVH